MLDLQSTCIDLRRLLDVSNEKSKLDWWSIVALEKVWSDGPSNLSYSILLPSISYQRKKKKP
jgi:hypothetical protein